ncbi:MAG: hypothetical protein KatS3mg103_1269 [Phycisphaerales bacterium]|nr:MAG: hypothetical protein KatS3mg103_1269 [Phycisphaerales bacterium]
MRAPEAIVGAPPASSAWPALLALCVIAAIPALLAGCSIPLAQRRAAPVALAHAAHAAGREESWASVMPWPGVEPAAWTLARRDGALGVPGPEPTASAGAWRVADRPSLDRWLWVTVPRSEQSLLFFVPRTQTPPHRQPPPLGADRWPMGWRHVR